MALASFFDKTALGASQILKGFDYTGFRDILDSHLIRIRFSPLTLQKSEGSAIIDMLIRLLARLYPNLQLHCEGADSTVLNPLFNLAKGINPQITITKTGMPTAEINVGLVQTTESTIYPSFYLGSDQWLGKFSISTPIEVGESTNPFGAGFAACLGAANLFRFIFKNQLPNNQLDEDTVFSTFDYSLNENANQGPELDSIISINAHLVGLGAIGNGTLWALSRLNLRGNLHLIDHEQIELTNLQRYVCSTQKDIKQSKVELAKRFLNQKNLIVDSFKGTWSQYLSQGAGWNLDLVGVAVDSAKARIEIQASLPRAIINAWTQLEQLGISRHFNFNEGPCLACLYMPENQSKSLSQEIADNLNLGEFEKSVIRPYLADKRPVDEPLLELICSKNSVSIGELSRFKGKQMEAFYSEIVCGGVFLRLSGKGQNDQSLHVPSAFESALAGILLAVEIILACKNCQRSLPPLTKINLIRPLTKYTLENSSKHSSKKCLCQDPIFIKAYNKKWIHQ